MECTLSSHLDAGATDYTPSKAMEYVATLVVLLKMVGHVDDWVDKALTTVRPGEAISSIEKQNRHLRACGQVLSSKQRISEADSLVWMEQ